MRVLFLLPLALLLGCQASGQACRCDLIATESECIEFHTPDNPLYAAQLQATCTNSLQSLCDTLGGTYEFGASCETSGLAATCTTDYFNYVELIAWYSTGGSPHDPSEDYEEDCGDPGVVERF